MNNRLTVLAADIRAAHTAIGRASVEMAERAVSAGHMLIEAKAALAHGAWDRWLRDHTGMSARTASRYMQLARSGLETATVADLGIRGASERLAKVTSRPKPDLSNNPDYLAWAEEMQRGLDAAPNPELREHMLMLMREQVKVERFAAYLRERMEPGELDKVCGWLDQADPRKVVKLLAGKLREAGQ